MAALEQLLPAGNAALTKVMRAAKRGGQDGLIDLPEARSRPQQTHTALPDWSPAQLGVIQKHLKRMGLYQLGVDRKFGPGTEFALVEAFGDNEWRYQPVATTIAALATGRTAEKRRDGKPADRTLAYGHLLGDGVLTLSVAIERTLGAEGELAEQSIHIALAARGFKLDPADGAVLMQLGGRQGADAGAGELFVRRNALTYTPRVGEPRQVHAVVRLIRGNDSRIRSEDQAGTFARDMTQTDVAMYAGSDRGGTGPGLGSAFQGLRVGNKDVYGTKEFETALAEQGKPHGRDGWEQFLWLQEHSPGYLKVTAYHDRGLYLNTVEPAGADFATRLLYWTIKRDRVDARTGEHGTLAAAGQAQQHEHPFRVLLFDGVTNQEFLGKLRATPGFGGRQVAMYANQQATAWQDRAWQLINFLDGIIAQQSPKEIMHKMDGRKSNTFVGTAAPSHPNDDQHGKIDI
jgi:hypothetical protein